MWILLPAVYLAVVHVAGDNVAVVPDLAAKLGKEIYLTTIIAYIIIGSVMAGLSAWIGVKTGQDLTVIVKTLFGCKGKKILAAAILAVSIPASTLTGGYYSGWVLQMLTGISFCFSVVLCIGVFSFLAAGWCSELLKISNYISIVLAPLVIILLITRGNTNFLDFDLGANINWMLVCALVGYNVGGMRPVLVVETAAYLSEKSYKAILLIILAKLFEGLFTLAVVHLVIIAELSGPVALSKVAEANWGLRSAYFFNVVLFCTFLNTMAPAMMVNAKQISILTGIPFHFSLALAGIIVCIGSFFEVDLILRVLSYTGVFMTAFIIYTAYFLHKNTEKQL